MKKLTELPDHSRVWVYTANKPIVNEEKARLEEDLGHFLNHWSSHGNAMEAAAEVINDYFIIVGLNESSAAASGCGIDKLVRKIQDVEVNFDVSLLNRQLVVFFAEQWKVVPLHQFWAMRKAGIVTNDTLVMNSLVQTVGEWKKAGILPFEQSWHQAMWTK
jgi:hypothetical protein